MVRLKGLDVKQALQTTVACVLASEPCENKNVNILKYSNLCNPMQYKQGTNNFGTLKNKYL